MGAYFHGPKYSRMRSTKLRAVYDVNEKAAKATAQRLNAKKVYSRIEDLLRDPEIDAVDICVPTPWHGELTMESAEAGKHVLCEKPIALDLKTADQMIGATRKANVRFMVAHVLRFDPAYAATKEVIDSGEIGEPLLALAARHSQLNPRISWYADEESTGGVAIDMHIHDLDYFNWIFGGPLEVASKRSRSVEEGWDHISSLLTYRHGTCFAEGSWWWREANLPFSSRLSLLCQRGGVEVDVRASFADPDCPMEEDVWVYRTGKNARLLKLARKDGYSKEIEYFVNCVKNDEEPSICKPEDARLALQLALATRQSAETQTTVNPDQVS